MNACPKEKRTKDKQELIGHASEEQLKPKEKRTKDKQELIGHASEEQLKHYQDVEIADLRRITDLI